MTPVIIGDESGETSKCVKVVLTARYTQKEFCGALEKTQTVVNTDEIKSCWIACSIDLRH